MQSGEKFEAFVDLIALLQSYYPRTRNDDARDRARKWAKPMARWPLEIIEEAVEHMPEISSEWFPSLGALMAECRSIAGQSAELKADAAREARQAKDDANYDRYLETLPSLPALQQEWIDKAPNKCERLGRQWMVEGKNKGRKADFTISAIEAKGRFAALFAAIGD